MKIQLSPTRIVPNVTTVWNQPGPEVDILYDLKKLGFRENSIDAIYSFHVLDRYFLEEVGEVLVNWYRCLKPGGKLWIKVDDFEVLCREFVGGGIDIDSFNREFTHAIYMTRDSLIRYLSAAGFAGEKQIIWFDGVPNEFEKNSYELVIEAIK